MYAPHHFHSYTQIKPLTSSTLVYKEECVYCFSKWVQHSPSSPFLSHRIKTKESMSVLPATKDSARVLQNTPASTSKNRAIRSIFVFSVVNSLPLPPPPHPQKTGIPAQKNSRSSQSAWKEALCPPLRSTKRTCKSCVWLAILRCQRQTSLCLILFVTHRCVKSGSGSC